MPTANEAHAAEKPVGEWDLVMDVHEQTSICTVNLPYFSREKPVKGTKAARESCLKLITGMYNDVCPLAFRSKYLADNVTFDPYYKPAPGWSTLSGGKQPFVVTTPAEFVEKMVRVADCVPLIRSTRIFVTSKRTKERTETTVEQVKAMDIKVQSVPNLYKKAMEAVASSSNVMPDLSPIMQRQATLEAGQAKLEAGLDEVRMSVSVVTTLAEQVTAMKDMMEKLAKTAAPAAPTVPVVSAVPAAAAAAAAEPAAAAAAAAQPIDDVEDKEDEPIRVSARSRAKRARK